MIHATEKYNRIQDPAGIIPEDEPVFLIRAQDIYAVGTIWYWLKQYEGNPDHDPERAKAVREHLKKVVDWPTVKLPGAK